MTSAPTTHHAAPADALARIEALLRSVGRPVAFAGLLRTPFLRFFDRVQMKCAPPESTPLLGALDRRVTHS